VTFTFLVIMKKRIGILTAGGDCPGLNAVIRAVVRRAGMDESEIVGIKNGWRGLVEGDVEPLTRSSVTGILPRGGTILGTSRLNPLQSPETLEGLKQNWEQLGLNALIVVGGDGTLSAALDLWRDHQLPVVGIPKTIDNDIRGTDFTFGFDTAVGVVTDAVDRLHSTAESHHRVMVVEVMGRHTGWIAAFGGIAGGADVVLVPEHPFKLSRVCELLRHREEQGRAFSIVVVAEDAHPHPDEDFLGRELSKELYRHDRLGGIGTVLAHEIERCTGIETRVTKLGYVQRGGSPTPFDRVLATRLGVKAYEMVAAEEWGRMAALHGNKIRSVSLEEAVSDLNLLDDEIYRVAEVFFG
jgi:phosphofructokinase-like protein